MKKPKVIRFRCYCVECDAGDKPRDNALQAAAAEPDRNNIGEDEQRPPPAVDSVEKMLFGA
ncbi:hypothetical protein [Rhizobium freirei]|uniref:hypothetical protein n=1 Tax=Rhizobium freirei TaxID=1353277 RepID=UPI00039CA37C|nr:hypothetical protein [Rhizobium freirei]